MKTKLLLTSVAALIGIAGGVWNYQASIFEKSMNQALVNINKSLQEHDVVLTYDEMKVSRFWLKAHLVNPVISGKIKDEKEDVNGTLAVKGDLIASFSPLKNTVTFEVEGDTSLKVDGAVGIDVLWPRNNQSKVVFTRNEYDFFGKNEFLSFTNIKALSYDAIDSFVLINDQKALSFKGAKAEILLNYIGKQLDVSLVAHNEQVKIHSIRNVLKGNGKELDDLNETINFSIIQNAAMDATNSNGTLSFHVDDYESYFNDVRQFVLDKLSKKEMQDISKLLPVGLSFEIKEWNQKDKIGQCNMTGSIKRTNDHYSLAYSGDFKVSDEWDEFCKIFAERLAKMGALFEHVSLLKNESFVKNIIPKIQTLGTIHLDVDFKTKNLFSLTAWDAFFQIKTDLYGVGAKHSLKEGGMQTLKVDTYNITPLMTDLEKYIKRIEESYFQQTQKTLDEFVSVRNTTSAIHSVMKKVLEPIDKPEQSIDIVVNQDGIRIGKYELPQVMTFFAEAMEKQKVSSKE